MLRRVNVETNARALCSRRAVEMFRNFCLCGEFQLWRGKRTRLSANGCVKNPRCSWHNVLLWDRKENEILSHENGEIHISFFLCTAHRHPDAKRFVDINIPLIKTMRKIRVNARAEKSSFLVFLSLFSIFQYFYRRNQHSQLYAIAYLPIRRQFSFCVRYFHCLRVHELSRYNKGWKFEVKNLMLLFFICL